MRGALPIEYNCWLMPLTAWEKPKLSYAYQMWLTPPPSSQQLLLQPPTKASSKLADDRNTPYIGRFQSTLRALQLIFRVGKFAQLLLSAIAMM